MRGPPAKEMDAAASPSRKRKAAGLDPLEAANSETTAAEGRGPGRAPEGQEPPLPGADAGGGYQEPPLPGAEDRISQFPDAVLIEAANPAAEDAEERDPEPSAEDQEPPLISKLPEALLQDIISLLPTKDGARTQLVASRWRHLWRSAPLNLDDYQLCQDPEDLHAVVSSILSAHLGPCRRFCAPVYHHHDDRAETADAWLLSPALRGLQELELWGFQLGLPSLPRPSPAAAFRFSETLVAATLGDCQFPDITAQAIHFPKLKKLVLQRVSVSDSSLHTIIAGCLALECLLIQSSHGFSCVRINSITLRSICVKSYPGKLIIENAPCLERLLQLYAYQSLHISVISAAAPKLETLGCLSADCNTTLVLGSTVIQGLRVDTLAPKVRTVKILSVDMRLLSLDTIINLMTCFPSLERLYIKCAGRETNVWRGRHKVRLTSFDIRLKKISWQDYRGTKSHVSFATFFVENAKVLELMTFRVRWQHYNVEYFAQQRKVLQLDSKASTGARFRFVPNDSHRDATVFRVDHLDLADPFEIYPREFHDL